MKEVLFLALEFAPLQQAGVFRSLKFVKYLRDSALEPVVLTILPQHAAEIFGAPLNFKLLDDLGYEPATYHLEDARPALSTESRLQRFIRLKTETNDSFYPRFRRSLQAQIEKIRERHDLRAVYVSLPPYGAGDLAVDAADMLGLPLVADMRDSWSQWGPFQSYLHFRIALRSERRLFSRAAAVVTVTDELSRLFQRSHPEIPSERFHVVPNGIDVKLPEELSCSWGDDPNRFKVAYVGQYYYDPVGEAIRTKRWYQRRPQDWLQYSPMEQNWLYRSPYFFFSALRRLREIDADSAGKFEFHQIGRTPPWLMNMATEFGVENQIVEHGTVPREEVTRLLAGMDMCLVTSLKIPGGEDYCLASKTFDYIQAGKATLAFVCPGSQARFLAEVKGSVVCDADDTEANAQTLADLLNRARDHRYERPEVDRYDRARNTAELAMIISGIMQDSQCRKRTDRQV